MIEKGKTSEPIFTISRTFNAPRDLVWKACTEPERMAQWWGPKGLTIGVYKMDLRVGGTYHYSMKTPDGREMWGKFVYREIIKSEKLVFINSFSDKDGGLTRHPMSSTWPLEMLSTFTFFEKDGKTTLTVQWTPLSSNEIEIKTFKDGMAGMNQGWGGTLDQLDDYLLKASKEIIIERIINAPRDRVWNAMTDPKQIVNWWGPKGFKTTIEVMDLRPGGIWKHIMHGPDGTDYPNNSIFIEVIKPERIVYNLTGGKKGAEVLSIITTWIFEDLGEKTKVIIHHVFPSTAVRDHVVKEYGAIEGAKQTLERLDGYLI